MPSTNSTSGKDREASKKTKRKPGRVPTSCAECRRLKLRCDKNVPCEKCVSRGCGSICPDGSLTPGKGNRLILANTEELHERIEDLCARNKQLETALSALQQSVSDQPHPLLQNGSLLHTPPVLPVLTDRNTPGASSTHTRSEEPEKASQSTPDEECLVDSFGTLALGVRGQCSFFGKTARSEYLIRAPEHQQLRTPIPPQRLSKKFIEACWPETGAADPALGEEIFGLLPPLSEAIRLCEIYQEHGKYLYTAVPRTELFDEILTSTYRVESFDVLCCYHALTLLLIIFAIATHFDPDKQPFSLDAQEFYYMSRVAIRFNPNITRLSIQALIHTAQYIEFTDFDATRANVGWMHVGWAIRQGHSAGLHLNSSRWSLSEPNVQRRSRIFWQLFHLDTWASFHFGRPPTMSASYIDIDYPIPTDSSEPPGSTTAAAPDEAKARVEFHAWTWQYSALLHSIIATAFGPKQPSYLTILALDRRVRDFFIPTFLRPVCDDGQPSFREIPVELHTKRWMVFGMKEITLLNLHRPYFVHAIREMPQELARHRYAPSVISVYRSAWRLIQVMRVWWKNASYPLSRTSQPWSYVLSAAIVMCLICTRAPTSTMAPPALAELDTLLETLQEAAPKAPAAANVLVSVINLHRKAHDVMDRRDTSDTLPFDPEIERLAGKTHLLAEMNAPDSATRGPSENITLTCTPGAYFSDAQVGQLHPTLARDMRTFDVDFFLDIPTVHGGSEDGRNGNAQLHVPDVRGADSGFYLPTNDFQMYQNHPPPPNPPHEQVAPMLDSTWHSFVEQLGF